MSDLGDTIETAGSGTLGTPANPLTTGTTILDAMRHLDVDCVAVRVDAHGSVLAQVSDGNGLCLFPYPRTVRLDLYGPDPLDPARMALLGRSERSGPWPWRCATIDGHRLVAGARVQAWAGDLAAGVYVVCAVPDGDMPSGARYAFTVAPLP
jgi:hypothetical protein